MNVDQATIEKVLRQLTACRRRLDQQAARIVKLERARDRWKQKAVNERHKNETYRFGVKKRSGVYWATGLTPDEINLRLNNHRRIVQRILQIPPRDIE